MNQNANSRRLYRQADLTFQPERPDGVGREM